MIKGKEDQYNQIKTSIGSIKFSSFEQFSYWKESLESKVQFRDQMASSQPTYSDNKSENVQYSPPEQKPLDNQTPMITLTLLHPQHSVAVQTWRFEPQSSIKIGRSRNNEVTLYSAVVSRHHVEIRRKGTEWEVISLGSNGTFCEGKRISRTSVKNGMVIRLASSGPQIQIWIDMLTNSKQEEKKAKENSPPLSTKEIEQAKQTQMD